MTVIERALEIGSGSNPRNNEPYDLKVASDINEHALKILMHDSWSGVVADAHALSFRDSSFDRVDCHHVLEHLANSQSALHEIYRVSKPGGQVELSVPHPVYDTIMAASLAGYYPYWSSENHRRVFTEKLLKEQINNAGLHIESIRIKGWWRALTTIRNYLYARIHHEPIGGQAVRIQSTRMEKLLDKKVEYFENVKVFDRVISGMNKYIPYEIRVSATTDKTTEALPGGISAQIYPPITPLPLDSN